MNRVEDNSKINININVNLDKKPTPPQTQNFTKVVGRRVESNATITVNPRSSEAYTGGIDQLPKPVQNKSSRKRTKAKSKSRVDQSVSDIQADFSNINILKENEKPSTSSQNNSKRGPNKKNKDIQAPQPNIAAIKQLIQSMSSRQSNTPLTYTHSQSFNQASQKIDEVVKGKPKKSKSKNKTNSRNVTQVEQKKSHQHTQSMFQQQIEMKNSERCSPKSKKIIDPNIVAIKKALKKKKAIQKSREKEEREKSTSQIIFNNVHDKTSHYCDKSKEKDKKKVQIAQKNSIVRQQNAVRFTKSQNKKSNALTIPWGMNQERIKTYLLQQFKLYNEKQEKSQMIQRMRQNKQDPNIQRRDQIGVAFLNHLNNKTIQEMLKKEKRSREQIEHVKEPQHIHNNLTQDQQEEVRNYKEWKARFLQMQELQLKQEASMKQEKIRENLKLLDQYVKQTRTRSQSDYQGRQKFNHEEEQQQIVQGLQTVKEKRKRKTSPGKNRTKGNKSTDEKKRELVLQFRNLAERFNQIQQQTDSGRAQGSMIAYINDSSNIPSDEDELQQNRLDELDTSFFSDRQYLITEQQQQIQVPTLGGLKVDEDILQQKKVFDNSSIQLLNELDEQEAKEIAEVRSIEQEALKKRTETGIQEEAALVIQRVWRGYRTRRLLHEYLQAMQFDEEEQQQQEEQQQDDDEIGKLSESQIEELIKLGYLRMDDEGNLIYEQPESVRSVKSQQKQNSNNSEKNIGLKRTIDEQNLRIPSEQAQGAQIIFDQEAYDNYIKNSDWTLELSSKKTNELLSKQNQNSKEETQLLHDSIPLTALISNRQIKQEQLIKEPISSSRKSRLQQEQQTQIKQEIQQSNIKKNIQEEIGKEDISKLLLEQNQKWEEMLQLVAGLQKKASQVDVATVLKNIKEISEKNQRETANILQPQKKKIGHKKQLSIDVALIEAEYQGAEEMDQGVYVSEKPIVQEENEKQNDNIIKEELKGVNSVSPQSYGQIRIAMGSESLLKEQSRSSSCEPQMDSVFTMNPFRDFAGRKFKELLKKDNMEGLIHLREQVIEDRRRSQGRLIKEMFQKNRISPKTFKREQIRLEKWVTKERLDLQNAKQDMQRGWQGTYDTFLRTQRDLIFMAKNTKNSKLSVLTNSFSHDSISHRFLLMDKDVHIKVIDNYNSESQQGLSHQLSHSALESEGSLLAPYTPMKDLQLSSDLRNQPMVAEIMQFQNSELQKKYIEYENDQSRSQQPIYEEGDLCSSQMIEVSNPQHNNTENVTPIHQQEEFSVPHTSPTPSPKIRQNNDWEDELLKELDDLRQEVDPVDVKRLGQTQGIIKISSILEQQKSSQFFEQSDIAQRQTVQEYTDSSEDMLTDTCANSYAIIITNILITQEIQQLHNEMLDKGIDLVEAYNRNALSTSVQNQGNQINNSTTSQRTSFSSDKRLQVKQSRGIKTNLAQVKSYLGKLIEYIEIDYSNDLLRQVNQPLGPSSKEMLRYLHVSEFNSSTSQFESSTDSTYQHSAILNTDLFADLEKQLMEQQFIKQNHDFLLELEHIHNKVVFDALNEALDYFRPYGLKGQPFPWKVDSTKLVPRKLLQQDVQQTVKKAEEKVIEWAQSLVGIIIDKEDSPFPKMLMFDPDYLNQIKEDRLLRMLQCEVVEQEERWINYDEEQTEIQVELADIVFDQLIQECVQELGQMGRKKRVPSIF